MTTDSARPGHRGLRWPIVVVALVLVAASAFAVGRFTMFREISVDAPPSTLSAEAGFARDMQVHHAQAVEMAMQIYRATEDDEIRALSYDIATAQSAQRGEMYDWLVQWGLPQASPVPIMTWMADASVDGHDHRPDATEAELLGQMGMATDAQLTALAAAEGTEADCLFLDLMITHHQGAIPMADAAVQLADDARVITVAGSISELQGSEIAAMRSMQERLGCTG